jgi:LacI family transcriptional regulator
MTGDKPRLNNGGKPTIDDVAALAGVSRTTVSRVLNDGPNVRPGLREKVRRAVDALDFKVNVQARNLAGQAGGQIALVHQSGLDTEPNSYYYAALELGALRACAKHGFQVVTRTVSPDRKTAKQQIRAMLDDGWVSGIILTPPLSDDADLLAAVRQHGSAVVCVSSDPGLDAPVPTIGIDDLAAGRAIARHLIALGHRRFGYIRGLAGHRSAELRFAGLDLELTEAGIRHGAIVEERGTFTFHSGIDCAQRILEAKPRPTCLMCANDDMAAGALLAIHRAGLSIPGDISVAGFDDTPLSEIVWPPLTTVHQPIKQIGQAAAEMVIAASARGPEARGEVSQRHQVSFHLVERDSTGAVPASDASA